MLATILFAASLLCEAIPLTSHEADDIWYSTWTAVVGWILLAGVVILNGYEPPGKTDRDDEDSKAKRARVARVRLRRRKRKTGDFPENDIPGDDSEE